MGIVAPNRLHTMKRKHTSGEPDTQDPICTKVCLIIPSPGGCLYSTSWLTYLDQIYFASRTHTQLAQAISELQKIPMNLPARAVPLGSRRNLCINEEIRKSSDIDESCRTLNQGLCFSPPRSKAYFDYNMSNIGKKGKRCSFLPGIDEEEKMFDFRDRVLVC